MCKQIGGIYMKYLKKISALALAAALSLTVLGSGTDASAFTKTKNGLTLKGESSIAKTKGSAWGSVSPKSYLSIASFYKYKNKSGEIKTVPTDLTGAGDSAGASWSYTLASGCVSKRIDTRWTGIYNNRSVIQEETITY